MKQHQISDSKKTWLSAMVFAVCFTSSLAMAQEPVRINPLNATPGESTIYQISFTAKEVLQSDGAIAITFPAEFDLSKLKMANSTTVKGGFKVSVQGNKATLQRSGLGRAIEANENVEIKFASIKNPTDAAKQYQATVEFIDKRDNRILRSEFVGIKLGTRRTKRN